MTSNTLRSDSISSMSVFTPMEIHVVATFLHRSLLGQLLQQVPENISNVTTAAFSMVCDVVLFLSRASFSFARCPAGRRLVTHGTVSYDICENIDECAEFTAAGVPLCRNGVCRDLDEGYVCHCHPGYVGADCSTRAKVATWSLGPSSVFYVTSAITIILGRRLWFFLRSTVKAMFHCFDFAKTYRAKCMHWRPGP